MESKTISGRFRVGLFVILLGTLLAAVLVPCFADAEQEQVANPDQTIDLSQFGYSGLSPESRFLKASNVTLNFLDSDHVLFTFNQKRLIQRLPECPPSHKDRVVEAQIVELSTRKVIRRTTWYLHDERRYLWPLGNGNFLLRRLNSLYQLGPDLHETLLLAFPKQLLWTSVTPDGKQIIVETAADDKQDVAAAASPTSIKIKANVKIQFLDSGSLAVQRTIRLSQALPLSGTSLGFADAVHNISGKIWLVRFGTGAKDRSYITRVRSRCVPDLQFPTNNTIFVGRCSAEGTDYSVSVFTLTGHFLWREKWTEHRYEPAIERSDDESRVAISTIAGVPNAAAMVSDEASEDNRWPQVQQFVRVVNAATGLPVLSVKVASVVLKGQNFALSPDGSRFVALDGTELHLFDLPSMSADERGRYVALQADTPALAAPAPRVTEEASNSGDEVFDVATEGTETDPPKQAAVAAPPGVTSSSNQSSGGTQSSDTAHADASTITFRSSSKTVALDVVVTDSKGRPVRNLRAEDFQVQEDGKPQRVNYFHEFVSDSVSDKGSGAKLENASDTPKPSPNIFTNDQLTREDEPVTVFLLDLLNTPIQDQVFAKQQLIRFLANRPKGSQFALCTLANNLRLIQGFTTDESQLISAVNGKKGGVRWSPLLETNKGLNAGLQMQKEVAAFDASKQFVVQMFEQAAAEERNQELAKRVGITVDAFLQLARYLAGVPGRKNVVWLSASFPLSVFPNSDLFDAFSETRNYADKMKKAANLLGEAHVSVYPVDIRGLVTQSFFAASSVINPAAPAPGSLAPAPAGTNNSGLLNTGANVPTPNPLLQNTHESLEQEAGDQSTMDQIASDTGGKAFYSTNGISEAIQTAVDQGSNYYILSYTPWNRNYDGKFRKIKASLTSKGYHLSYRRGYFAVDPLASVNKEQDVAADLGAAAMEHGSPQSHQILFAARVVPVGKPEKVDPSKQSAAQERKKKKQPAFTEVQHYAVDYAIAGPQLRFVEQGEIWHGSLDFMVSAFDEDGKALTRVASRTNADLKPASYKDVMIGGFRLRQEFDVPTTASFLRLGVADELSRNLGTVEISLPVPPPIDDPSLRAHALPPIEPN